MKGRGYNGNMTFRKLAEYLGELEKTPSRLEMTRVLAKLFSEADADEVKIVAYMIQGMLGPKYNNPDMGVAEKQMVKALGGEAGEIFGKTGDLGITVEQLKSQIPNYKSQSNSNKQISTSKVYKKLQEIAKASGLGSQEKKQQLIGELMEQLDPVGAKYAVKMILGKLRGGFSDMTILDALSWIITGDKSLRAEIERIYNVRADLGEVAEIVKEKQSDEAIKRLSVTPIIGTPVLVARAEREKTLALIWERNCPTSLEATKGTAAEHKLDGLRIQAHVKKGEVKLFSRGLENVTVMYPDIVEGLEKQVKEECILDGEMIAVDEKGRYLPFQETVQRKRKYSIKEMAVQVPLKYYVFDVLTAGGESYLDKPNEERWKKLEKLVNPGDVVRLIPRKIVNSVEEMEKFFKEAMAEGTEGIVVKKLDGKYRSGSRDFGWIKYKKSYDETGVADTIDAVVMGYDAGQGKRTVFGIGGFLIGVPDEKTGKLLTIAKVGTGLTDQEWKDLRFKIADSRIKEKPEIYEVSKQMNCDFWVEPKMVVEIKADEITKSPMHSSGYALRFPRLVSFREKKPEEATSIIEMKRLFEIQRSPPHLTSSLPVLFVHGLKSGLRRV